MEPTIPADCGQDDLASTLIPAIKVYLLSSSLALQRRGLIFVNKNSCHGKCHALVSATKGDGLCQPKGRWLARFMTSW